jgi:hypothetical protein
VSRDSDSAIKSPEAFKKGGLSHDSYGINVSKVVKVESGIQEDKSSLSVNPTKLRKSKVPDLSIQASANLPYTVQVGRL